MNGVKALRLNPRVPRLAYDQLNRCAKHNMTIVVASLTTGLRLQGPTRNGDELQVYYKEAAL
jgi:hypothetical protein